MGKRIMLCAVGVITLTLLAYLNRRDGTFQDVYGWVWLGLTWIGLFFSSDVSCFGKRLSPKSQFLILTGALVFTSAMLWGKRFNAQRWRQFLYGVFLIFVYWDGIRYGIRLVR